MHEYSRNIELFSDQTGIEAVCHMEKNRSDSACLIYGYFIQNMNPDPPIFKGNFFIKSDDEGNEAYRIIWNEYLEGRFGGEQHVEDIGNGQFIFLYTFHTDSPFSYLIYENLDLDTLALKNP